ncbi:MAG: AraC family transcriptional regulator [Actinomycetota bacterium]
MDPLTGVFGDPRARGAFVLRAMMAPPWAFRIEDEAPLTLLAMLGGTAQVWFDDSQPVTLPPGAVALVKGPRHYTMADAATTPLQVIVGPEPHMCRSVTGEELADAWLLGPRTWGNDANGSTRMLIGTYHIETEVGGRLLGALPDLVHLHPDEWDTPLLPLLVEEAGHDLPGQDAMIDRLLDLLVLSVARTWLSRQADEAPAWFRAGCDPVIGPLLQHMHRDPSHPWTVAGLADEAGLSRAALARRFTEAVGEPPMTFLTNWRLTLAADLLCQPDETVGSVATKVGYSSPYALSTAFKRVRGMSPRDHRRLHLSTA